jgi:magnesium transporter
MPQGFPKRINKFEVKNVPKKAAARLMTDRVPLISPNASLADVEKTLLKKAKDFESLNYFYVLDSSEKLVGVVSIKELFSWPKERKVSEIMQKSLVTARPHTLQERVALLSIRHSLKAIPITESDGRFLGVIPSDTILNVLHSENIEDDLLSTGIHLEDPAKSIIEASALVHVNKRLPWLVVGLLGGILAAFIVEFFEGAWGEHLILAAFIPLIVYMADAVGAQTQTLYIRSMALDHRLGFKGYAIREVKIALVLALSLGLAISAFSFLWTKALVIGLILGVSVFVTIIMAMALALFMPWFFTKRGLDPAIASGPLATVIRDVSSLTLYFFIAQLLLPQFS